MVIYPGFFWIEEEMGWECPFVRLATNPLNKYLAKFLIWTLNIPEEYINIFAGLFFESNFPNMQKPFDKISPWEQII